MRLKRDSISGPARGGKIGFVQEYGATCKDERRAWSYVNEKKEYVIFGAWQHHETNGGQLIFSHEWKRSNNGYHNSLRHIEHIQEEGYELYIFGQAAKEPNSKGAAQTKSFDRNLELRKLEQIGPEFFAHSIGKNPIGEGDNNADIIYWEGDSRELRVSAYERNGNARKRCIDHYKPICQVCQFDFKKTYGEIGSGFIHVHHLVKVADREGRYEVDPIKDLRPVCPNCHAMIHKNKKHFSIDKLREIMNSDANRDRK